MKKEEKGLFRDAVAEIKQLRETNYTMGLRLRMFDDVMTIFRARDTVGGICMGEDVVYKIEKAIEADNLDNDPPKTFRSRLVDDE